MHFAFCLYLKKIYIFIQRAAGGAPGANCYFYVFHSKSAWMIAGDFSKLIGDGFF